MNIDKIKPPLDSNGQVKKTDFVDYCMEHKLLEIEEKEEKVDTKKEKKKEVFDSKSNFM